MKLIDTIELMQSNDYKDRFKAEYYQLENRCDGLKAMLDKWDKDELPFKPVCPRYVYEQQLEVMLNYLFLLKARANTENIQI